MANRSASYPRENLGSAGGMMQDEAGASDNRISWNPNSFPETAKWEDGQEYSVTLKIRQTAPGEAIVLSLQSAGEAEPEPAESAASENAPEAPAEDYGGNPAIAKAMASRKG